MRQDLFADALTLLQPGTMLFRGFALALCLILLGGVEVLTDSQHLSRSLAGANSDNRLDTRVGLWFEISIVVG